MPSVSNFATSVAKLLKNESNAKEKNDFYVALLSDSDFGTAKVTKKRKQCKYISFYAKI